jgi:NADPH:quinone reductase-like Zn-dependent oxidoreductase
VDHIVNYKTDDKWGETARAFTSRGFDHIIDVAGAGTLGHCVDAIANEGIISLIGFMGKGDPPGLLEALHKGFIARGIGIGSRTQFEAMNRAIEGNNIQPFVDKVFKFEDAKEAYKHLQGQTFIGKVVIEM